MSEISKMAGDASALLISNPSSVFKENVAQLPSSDTIARIDFLDAKGTVVSSLESKPGTQGSVAVYNYVKQAFGILNTHAAEHALLIYAEHTADARQRPGAHPNVDRLLQVIASGEPLHIHIVGQ